MASTASPAGLIVSDRVATALDEGCPVVALESTIITHGLSYPENVRAASRCAQAKRSGCRSALQD